jgi:hypothetical protein
MKSTSARKLSRILQPLEDRLHIHITMDLTLRSLEIAIPRLQLEFYVTRNDSRIYSRQYRGMVVDDDQSIGTLVGLVSKLVLRNAKCERQILIPVPRRFSSRQCIVYQKDTRHHHVQVMIDKGEADKVYVYILDKILGRVLDNGDLQAKLLLSYLHALTSSCTTDTFTGYTGTESALTILRSAAVRSFGILTTENVNLLTLLAKVSPVRKFYPPFEKVMQQVAWNAKLSPYSQWAEFSCAVRAILDQAQKMQLFYPRHTFKDPRRGVEWKSSGKSSYYAIQKHF